MRPAASDTRPAAADWREMPSEAWESLHSRFAPICAAADAPAAAQASVPAAEAERTAPAPTVGWASDFRQMPVGGWSAIYGCFEWSPETSLRNSPLEVTSLPAPALPSVAEEGGEEAEAEEAGTLRLECQDPCAVPPELPAPVQEAAPEIAEEAEAPPKAVGPAEGGPEAVGPLPAASTPRQQAEEEAAEAGTPALGRSAPSEQEVPTPELRMAAASGGGGALALGSRSTPPSRRDPGYIRELKDAITAKEAKLKALAAQIQELSRLGSTP
mmetsp:Transcript_72324/g.188103  ORF Transcript_72324/g.188103 Transcript_72324/m.188103 type:complete len:271 (+) Transcript_72324:2145-2957(+)